MAHTCEECGMECYCDGDDMGGQPQPASCRCLKKHEDHMEDSYRDMDLEDVIDYDLGDVGDQ